MQYLSVLYHPLQPADLPFDAAQPREVAVFVLGVPVHGAPCPRQIRSDYYTPPQYRGGMPTAGHGEHSASESRPGGREWLLRTGQRGGRSPSMVIATSLRTAALDGRVLAAVRAWRQ